MYSGQDRNREPPRAYAAREHLFGGRARGVEGSLEVFEKLRTGGMQRVHVEAAGVVAQRQQRGIVPDDLRELVGDGGEQLVAMQLRDQRIRNIEQRSQPVPLPDGGLLGEK